MKTNPASPVSVPCGAAFDWRLRNRCRITCRRILTLRSLTWPLILALATALPGLRAQTIPNPSFEANATFATYPGYVSENTAIIGWTAGDPAHIGLNFVNAPPPFLTQNPFADNGAVPNGVRVAFIQSVGGTSTLSTTITGLVVGTSYRVQFRANRRASPNNAPTPSFRLNGAAPVRFVASPAVNPPGFSPKPYYTINGIFTATATTAGLAISNNSTQDSALLVDNFTISAATAIQVTNANNDGPGSLRQAVLTAAASSACNVITFAPALSGQTITLLSEIEINDAGGVVIDASALASGLTITGAGTNRLFDVGSGSICTLRRLTLSGGNAPGTSGGAVLNTGILTVSQCLISQNTAAFGAGVANLGGQLALTQCTLANNQATYAGGAVYSDTTDLAGFTTTLTQCTLTGNDGALRGGGVYNDDGRTVLTHCTISGNHAPSGEGAGVASHGNTLTETVAEKCIIAGNGPAGGGTPGDVDLVVSTSNNSFTSLGCNHIDGGEAVADFNVDGDVPNSIPYLQPLASNGGPTPTMALSPSSYARNRAVGSTVTTDQRGLPIIGTADIGAYEVQKGSTFVLSQAGYTFDETAGFKTIYVRRVGGFEGTVSVHIASTPGTATAADFATINQTLNFYDTYELATASFAITTGDLAEGNETFTVTLSAPSAGMSLGTPASAVVTIKDASTSTFAGDNIAPAVTIASPVNGSSVGMNSLAPLTIAGTATDNQGVRRVMVTFNGVNQPDAVLANPGGRSTAYTATVLPQAGTNTVSVRSVDFATGSGVVKVTASSTGSPIVTVLSVPLGLVVNSDLLGRKVTAISGNTVTLNGNAPENIGFVEVTSSSTTSPTVTVLSVPPGLALGSILLGKTVTTIAGTTLTLSGNANATLAASTFVAFTPAVQVTSSSTVSPEVFLIAAPSILTGGSTFFGRTVTIAGATYALLNGNANANINTVFVNVSMSTSPSVTLTSATLPSGFLVGSSMFGRTVEAIDGTQVTLDGNGDTDTGIPGALRSFGPVVTVISSSTASKTVIVASVPTGLAVGSQMLGCGVNAISGTTVTLNANSSVNIGTVTVNTSATNTSLVTVASVPSGLGVGSALLGRTVYAINGTSISLIGFANAATTSPTPRPFTTPAAYSTNSTFTPVVLAPFTTTDRVSPTVTSTFKVLRPLAVQIAGNGSVSAGFAPSSFREAGRFLSITATPVTTPAPGFLFTGWSVAGATPQQIGVSATALEKPALNFVFQEGLVLRANFVPNPYLAGVVGTFNGGVSASHSLPDRAPLGTNGGEDGTAPGLSTEGSISLTVLSTGGFSGTVMLDGLSLGVAGVFDQNGVARFGTSRATTLSVARPEKPSLGVALHMNAMPPTASGVIAGTIAQLDGTQLVAVSDVSADRSFYSSTNPVPAGEAGTFSTAFIHRTFQPGLSSDDYPRGNGYGAVTVTTAGAVSLTGTLADSTPVTMATTLSSGDGHWRLFAQLYNKQGFLAGDMAFSLSTTFDIYEETRWVRPAQDSQHYPVGWQQGIMVDTFAAKYTVTPSASVLQGLPPAGADNNGNADLDFLDGLLASNVSKDVSVTTADAVTNVPADASFTLTINRTTGAFSGTFTHSDGTKPAFKGMIFNKAAPAFGLGFFLTTSPAVKDYTGQSGGVTLAPQP